MPFYQFLPTIKTAQQNDNVGLMNPQKSGVLGFHSCGLLISWAVVFVGRLPRGLSVSRPGGLVGCSLIVVSDSLGLLGDISHYIHTNKKQIKHSSLPAYTT